MCPLLCLLGLVSLSAFAFVPGSIYQPPGHDYHRDQVVQCRPLQSTNNNNVCRLEAVTHRSYSDSPSASPGELEQDSEFGSAAALKDWLKNQHRVDEDDAAEAAEKLFDKGFKKTSRLFGVTVEILLRAGIEDALAVELSNKLKPPTYAELVHQRELEHQASQILNRCVYEFGMSNGVDPSKYVPRAVEREILDTLPKTFTETSEENTVGRILLYGAPGSGKTSILGKIYEELKMRYQRDVPVFYVSGSVLKTKKVELRDALLDRTTRAVVILDDAHLWYDSDFFELFKAQNYLLVAAATYGASFNPTTPVSIQRSFSSALLADEVTPLFDRMNVDVELRSDLIDWFGYSFGRIRLLVPKLLDLWKEAKKSQPDLALSDCFYRGSTLTELDPGIVNRFVPALSDDIKDLLLRQYMGQLDSTDAKKLARYGVLTEKGDWSCEFVRRWYFSSIFQSSNKEWELIGKDMIPSSLELLKKGLEELNWSQLRDSGESSKSGFPIEDIWKAHFYFAIGHFIPKDLIFCKEKVVGSDKRVDFVLRNGSTHGIEFLVKSDRVEDHHKRFEEGGVYAPLKLDEYIVVDILPWNRNGNLKDASDRAHLQVVNKLFRAKALTPERRGVHAVFLVSDDLEFGIMYTWDETTNSAVESTRSPTANH